MEREDLILQKLDSICDSVCNLETRFDGLETRFDGLETRFDGLETRFDGLENRFDDFQNDFKRLEGRVDGLDEKVDKLVNTVKDQGNKIDLLNMQVSKNTSRIDSLEEKFDHQGILLENTILKLCDAFGEYIDLGRDVMKPVRKDYDKLIDNQAKIEARVFMLEKAINV